MTGEHEFLLSYKRSDEREWKRFAFSDLIQVGSDEECHLQIEDGELNGLHFEIRENPTGVFLKWFSTVLDEQNSDNMMSSSNTERLQFGHHFYAGLYEFIFSINEPVSESNAPLVSNLVAAFKDFGAWKIVLLTLGGLAAAVVTGVFITRLWIEPAVSSEEAVYSPTAVESVEEAVGLEEPVSTETFEITATQEVVDINEEVVVPGAGVINLESILMDTTNLNLTDVYQFVMSSDENMDLLYTLSGENVGYIYQYTGMIVDEIVVSTSLEYIDADNEELVDGIASPVWNEGEIPIKLDWSPFIYEIHDGSEAVMGFLIPEVYDASEASAIYYITGVYRPNGSEQEYNAHLRFDGTGQMIDLLTFGKVGSDRPTPYKVIPKNGDTFTVYQQEFIFNSESLEEMDIDILGNNLPPQLITLWKNVVREQLGEEVLSFGPGEFHDIEGKTLTFGDSGIWWTKLENVQGEFVTGLAVSDLDGNFFLGYFPLNIIN